jgi:hypothetical protein
MLTAAFMFVAQRRIFEAVKKVRYPRPCRNDPLTVLGDAACRRKEGSSSRHLRLQTLVMQTETMHMTTMDAIGYRSVMTTSKPRQRPL